ncbi:hypothetical protein NDU88_004670 [Pleurodeles waltl]|uniref:Secreted protein n=1 Tax=Pleurodeles waltl TaxID=8319 RepID=A0AAV7T8S3_PLEWA|nr:hypothetical protein NDU88_004670 [Pleurodeles waltl]
MRVIHVSVRLIILSATRVGLVDVIFRRRQVCVFCGHGSFFNPLPSLWRVGAQAQSADAAALDQHLTDFCLRVTAGVAA